MANVLFLMKCFRPMLCWWFKGSVSSVALYLNLCDNRRLSFTSDATFKHRIFDDFFMMRQMHSDEDILCCPSRWIFGQYSIKTWPPYVCILWLTHPPAIRWHKYELTKVSWNKLFYSYYSHGLRLSSLGTAATVWPIVPASDDRWWVWSSRWNANWQGKPKYSEKTCPSAT
jgi:hypothetical protein